MSKLDIAGRRREFRKAVLAFHKANRRDFPWRRNISPYRIFVSELMLQQTQTQRIAKRFPAFLRKFPSWKALAEAPTAEVLGEWQGLGYNRRALSLQRTAQVVWREYRGKLPEDRNALLCLPGVGPYTAGALRIFSFNLPDAIIETNIRALFLYLFFPGKTAISDKEILPLIEDTCDRGNPREWFYALMDYGSALKESVRKVHHASSHHRPQTPFRGSARQLRGALLRILTDAGRPLSEPELGAALAGEAISRDGLSDALSRYDFRATLTRLAAEGFLRRAPGGWGLAQSATTTKNH
jgi:A/G-specific adenine glycosylase